MMIPQEKNKNYTPEKQGLGHSQRQASPMDTVQCGLLILGIDRDVTFISKLFFSVKTVKILHLLSF